MAPVLEVRDLQKSFGAVVAAKDIDVTIEADEIVGIIGANGAGKTTFVNMVTGYLRPSAGSIRFQGRDILGLPPRRITRLGMCRSFQVSQVFMSETVFDNLMVAFAIAEEHGPGLLKPLHDEARAARVDAHLERFRIAEHRDAVAAKLPQGVRKLLDIAMATVRRPALLLLDEPTSGISAEEKFDLMDIIMAALKQDRTTVLFIEHDMEIVERFVSRVLAFYQGEIVCDKPTAEAMRDPKVLEFVLGLEYHAGHRGGGGA
jgi:branched-chain amino acid transport system ATP-binding protein